MLRSPVNSTISRPTSASTQSDSQHDSQRDVTARPFLKWAGGKGRVLSQYVPYFPTFSTYYEPFLGGGAVFFYLQSALSTMDNAYLMDINDELINVYRCIRDQVEGLIEHLTIHQRHHCHTYYYGLRANVPEDRLARAARFLYLNKTCFNGLYRENLKGQFNVPMGRYKNPNICPSELLQAASNALKLVKIEVNPFELVLELANTANDFVYFDPPYHPISATSNFTGYSRYSFREEDQIRLKDTFSILADRGVKVMLSNSDCPFIRQLYREFSIHTIFAARSINSKAKKRGKITEVLVTSY
ncbi:MAG: DNA adenine methylase [Cyanobacteria bacterium P01_F01_bin.150]